MTVRNRRVATMASADLHSAQSRGTTRLPSAGDRKLIAHCAAEMPRVGALVSTLGPSVGAGAQPPGGAERPGHRRGLAPQVRVHHADPVKRYDIDSIENRDPAAIRRLADWLEPFVRRYFRPVVTGLERIPRGPCLYVGNHNGGLLTPDTFVFGIAAYRRLGIDALPYGLGHEQAIRWPGVHQLLVPLGAVRAGHDMAARLFAAGHKALVYPGSDLDAFRPYRLRDRIVFGPRRGYIRLALRQDVPIVPLVAAGAHATWIVLDDGQWLARAIGADRWLRSKCAPIALSIPWGLTIGVPLLYIPLRTRILIECMEPIRFERRGPDAAADAAYVEACHRRVHGAMEATLARLAAERRALDRA